MACLYFTICMNQILIHQISVECHALHTTLVLSTAVERGALHADDNSCFVLPSCELSLIYMNSTWIALEMKMKVKAFIWYMN
jgi:hypothetical protein